MGKQICFFASSKDIKLLIDQVQSLCAIIVDCSGNMLNSDELWAITDANYRKEHLDGTKFFISRPYLSLCYYQLHGKSYIDQLQSEVIELSFCRPSPVKIIDTSSVDNHFIKNGYVVIDDSEKYHGMMNELMKHPVYVLNPNYIENGFEYGRLWYSPDCMSGNGIRTKKSKELHELYNALRRFIQHNYKLTKDKFAYIGPDAYEKYKQGNFVPCSGSQRIVVD